MEYFFNLSTKPLKGNGVRAETEITAAIGDQVEILLPAYRHNTGIIFDVSTTRGFGLTCSIKIDGAAETLKLPCFRVKVIERKPDDQSVQKIVTEIV